jgi:hypothetical protein
MVVHADAVGLRVMCGGGRGAESGSEEWVT